MRLILGMFAAIALATSGTASLAVAADEPLALVPASSSVFAHLRVAELWNAPLVQGVRFLAKSELEKSLGEFKKEVGFGLDMVDTATFFYPNMPQGPGDEKTFMVVVTTTKPFDKDALLPSLRVKDAKFQDNLLKLSSQFNLYLSSPTMFVVLHDSLVEKFKKGVDRDGKPGVMSEALKLAQDKHQFVFSIDFSKLPNELFTAAPPELQPFLPILKSKSSCLFADLKQAQIDAGTILVATDASAAEDAERSFKLLMKLAGDGIAQVQMDSDSKKEIEPFLPLFKELDASLKNLKFVRKEERLEASLTVKVDQVIAGVVAEYVKKVRSGAGRSQALNNLRQISLAMHNYHDVNNGLPPAAICDKKGKPLLSWRVAILPYIEQQNLYNEFKLDEPWDSEHNKKLLAKMPPIYAAADSDKTEGKTHFRVFYGNGAVFDIFQQTKLTDIVDGTSNTIMVVDAAEPVEWSKPEEIEFDDKTPIEKLLRFVDGRVQVAFCDGSVRSLRKGLDEKTWRNLIQKNDGQPLPDLEK